jgi:hypothetical protein
VRPREQSSRADALRTLLIFTVLQAFLLTVNLHLLPMWGDEASTLACAPLPVSGILKFVRADIHPPLYFLLAHVWLKVTRFTDPLVALRLLSALYSLAATILLDRLWLREATLETRQWMLQLWAFSPCMLLFGRMARSYSLQVLLTILAVWALLRFAEDYGSWKRLVVLAASLTALLYTHYLPGVAVWGGANVLLLMRLRHDKGAFWRMWVLPNALVAAAYAPWMVTLAAVLPRWQHKDLYSLTGNSWMEAALKFAYGFYSLAFGEAIPLWLLFFSALLAGPYLWVLVRGARAQRQWLLPAATVALLGYIGAAHWVSYPFMGARLLFLLPLLLVAAVAGIGQLGRVGTVFGVALFAANAGGVWAYFKTSDILNIAYVAPSRQIAAVIAVRSSPADTLVLVDGLNVDAAVIADYLPLNFALGVLRSPADAATAWSILQSNSHIRHVWFLQSPHDISPGHAFEKLQAQMMGAWYSHTLHPFVQASAIQRWVMKYAMHIATPPGYVYEVWEFRR